MLEDIRRDMTFAFARLLVAGSAVVSTASAFTAQAVRQAPAARTLPAPSGYTLAWSDEFDRDGAPDPATWGYEEGFVRNNEAQWYTRNRRENARVANGMLVIEARKERFANPEHNPAR